MSHHTYQPPNSKDWRIGLLIIFGYILVISLSAFWLLLDYWYLWLLIVVAGLIWVINWHTHSYAYQCLHCG
ncbi:MAG: hypothetical protein JW862_12100, partial [Anaerolineales bacterium]|nr:hypothetical protein [Anaerolineales bacterium]